MASIGRISELSCFILIIAIWASRCCANDILGCGGFVQSHVKLDFSEIVVGLYTKEGSLKEKTECAPTNGYYFLPLYEKGDYVLRIHPPAGLSFEPSEVELSVDGVTDKCSTGQDINFSFNGFGINGKVVTAGQKQGPSGVSVQLVDEKGEKRNTVTTVGGDFHFTAVIPGKYIVKASHPKWKLEPSQVEVQMKEGKMPLPLGVVLTVKGYDVSGSITSFGNPIQGLYVLLYAKVDPKFRVEGCNTALLQGVPDSPICHVTTSSTGEFTFGLVPAGEYKLLALSNTPGKPGVSYNIRPDEVPFTVRHDSLYIKNAFEVTGFTIIGTVEAKPGKGLSGARVSLDGTPVGTSDGEGKFKLAQLQPGVYTVSFEHADCKIPAIEVRVEADTVRPVTARVGSWRVCGSVSPPAARVALSADGRDTPVAVQGDGAWCTFLPPGEYTARVDVTDQELREGLQFFPVSRKVSVGQAPVSDVSFSQLKATVSGVVRCESCDEVTVTLRPLSPDGGYTGTPVTTTVKDGAYSFGGVSAGAVEVSVWCARACWAEGAHYVLVAAAEARVPDFAHTGYLLKVHSSHDVEVEYSSASSRGVLSVPRGPSAQCVPAAALYTLTPRSCHRFTPDTLTVDTTDNLPDTVYLVATAHAVGVQVTSPEPVTDLTLTITRGDSPAETAGPLSGTKDGATYLYEHTLYLADGEVATVSASSSSLVFQPVGGAQVVGRGACQPRALLIRALRAAHLAGVLHPPVADVTVTLYSEESEVASTVTGPDGAYRFGPLDASRAYRVEARKDSYVFSEPDERGTIRAQKLAQILVELFDDADGSPLQGALVSASGGSFRRTVGSLGGAASFGALWPGQYYVKPNMKEFRFEPPHALVDVEPAGAHRVSFRGVRRAWSCEGALVSLAGAGWGGAALLARPRSPAQPCAAEETLTEPDGTFRIRGLLPDCEYELQLKESSQPDLAGLRIVKGPASLKVEKADIVGVRVVAAAAAAASDGAVVVVAAPQHYRGLTLTLVAEGAPHAPLLSAKVDAAGFSERRNPGVVYVLPRLAADNASYTLRLESNAARAQRAPPLTRSFAADGRYHFIQMHYEPQMKSTEQELRQSTVLVIPLVLAALLYRYWGAVCAAVAPSARAKRARGDHDAAKRTTKKKLA